MVAFQPAEPEPDREPETNPVLEQVESFIWVCTACGEINLSGSEHCRICKAARADTPETTGEAETPKT